jgi:hypothetical protein
VDGDRFSKEMTGVLAESKTFFVIDHILVLVVEISPQLFLEYYFLTLLIFGILDIPVNS